MVISPSMRSRLLDINLVANQNMGFTLPSCRWGGGGTGDRSAGEQEVGGVQETGEE